MNEWTPEELAAMQALADLLPVAVFMKDAQSRFLLMNKTCEAQWGMSFADLKGNDAAVLFPPEQMAWFLAKDREIFAGGQAVDFEESFWNAELHQNRVGHTFKKPLYDAAGKPLYLICITLDITESRDASRDLQLSEEKLRTMFDMSPLGMARNTMDGRFIEANRAFLDIVGYSLEELNQLSYWDLTPRRYADEEVAQLESLRSQSRYGPYEKEYIRRDSKHIPVRLNGVAITGSDGEKFIWSIVEDISAYKRAQQALAESEARFRLGFENANIGMYLVDLDGKLLQVNRQMCRMFGYSRAELEGMHVNDITHPDSISTSPDFMARAEAGDIEHAEFEKKYIHKSGELVWGQVSSSLVRDAEGKPMYFISHVTDITERKLATEKLQLAALVYEKSGEGMMVTDGEHRILDVNPAFTRTTGYTLEEVVGRTPHFLNSGRQDEAFYRDMLRAIQVTGRWQGEIWNRRKDGSVYAEWQSINTIFNPDGSVHRHVALFSDITQKKLSDELIWRQANFDSLTNLPNRRMFQDRLGQEMKRSIRSGLPLALMFIDLDHFKQVNDTLGHDLGDRLLVEAAGRIASCVRESDTVARLGGDEFTVIVPALEDVDSVDRIAQTIITRLSQPFRLGDESAYVSASIGITMYPADAPDVDALLKHADQAMYVAKSAGRNRFSYFTQELQEAAQLRLRLTNDLRNALAEQQLSVYYQPIVEMATGAIHKAEALIRWLHPERGMVSPVQFIPLAEESGLINQIGDWVFQETARQVKHWRATHAPLFQVSVNKSPVQFREGRLEGESNWLAHLAALSLHGQSISVEITEGLLLNAEEGVQDHLEALRDAGVQVSIDDFGTGYSALAYLKKFDIDYLKIDQAFVSNLEDESDDLALCEAIIVMAHKLGLKVIAEGVETQLQHDILLRAGCDYAQGFLYSKALPVAEFEELLAHSRVHGGIANRE